MVGGLIATFDKILSMSSCLRLVNTALRKATVCSFSSNTSLAFTPNSDNTADGSGALHIVSQPECHKLISVSAIADVVSTTLPALFAFSLSVSVVVFSIMLMIYFWFYDRWFCFIRFSMNPQKSKQE